MMNYGGAVFYYGSSCSIVQYRVCCESCELTSPNYNGHYCHCEIDPYSESMNYIFESSIFSTGELGNGHGIISLRFGLISMAYNNISQCNSNYFSGYIIDTPKKPQMSLFDISREYSNWLWYHSTGLWQK